MHLGRILVCTVVGTLALSATACAQTGTGSDVEAIEVGGTATRLTPGGEVAVSGEVARAMFATEIVDREPVDAIDSLTTGADRVFFFTELRDFGGTTVTHRWEWNGEVMAEVPFDVGGPRWRVYSTKSLQPGWVGTWTVTVLDPSGTVLETRSLEYRPAAEGSAPAAPDTGAH
jgi:hypothetical protein